MAEDNELKIKGAAGQLEQVEEKEAQPTETAADERDKEQAASAVQEQSSPSAETRLVESGDEDTQSPTYRWCKCYFEPEQPGAQNFYFMHFDTREIKYEEPSEPYWIWDALLNNVHTSGLQNPTNPQQPQTAPGTSLSEQKSEPDPGYQGYNPKIHGSYDPNAPYAQYHKQKVAEEKARQNYSALPNTAQAAGDYTSVGAFNRFSGGFQSGEKSTDRHNDVNKNGRQLNAFFDVDAAANSHDGRSLKDERRSQKLSKKEIAELSKKRRDKKEKKRLDFYKS